MSVPPDRDMYQMVFQSRDNLPCPWVGIIVTLLYFLNEILTIPFLAQNQKGVGINTIRYGVFPSEGLCKFCHHNHFASLYSVGCGVLDLSGYVSRKPFTYISSVVHYALFFIHHRYDVSSYSSFYLQVLMRGSKGINAQEIPIKFYGKPYFL